MRDAILHYPAQAAYVPPAEEAIGPVIDAENVTIRFGKFTAVNRASLTLGRGEVFGLLGPNGSGETTPSPAACGLSPAGGGFRARLRLRRHARHGADPRPDRLHVTEVLAL